MCPIKIFKRTQSMHHIFQIHWIILLYKSNSNTLDTRWLLWFVSKQNCCCLTRNIQKSNSKAKRKDKVEQNELILQKWERVLVEIAKKIHPQSAMAILEIQEGLRNLKLMPHLNLVVRQFYRILVKSDIFPFLRSSLRVFLWLNCWFLTCWWGTFV